MHIASKSGFQEAQKQLEKYCGHLKNSSPSTRCTDWKWRIGDSASKMLKDRIEHLEFEYISAIDEETDALLQKQQPR